MPNSRSVVALTFAAVVMTALVACSDADPSGPTGDPLAGLAAATRGDSASGEAPDSSHLGPGFFIGTLYGYEPGPDTLASSVRIEGARVTAYVKAERDGSVVAGEQVATVLTNAQGFFRLPTLPTGLYVVTFVPPVGSPFRGGWTTAQAWQQSGDMPWHIMLPKK